MLHAMKQKFAKITTTALAMLGLCLEIAFAVNNSDPEVFYYSVPMAGGSDGSWGNFVGNNAFIPIDWVTTKSTLSSKLKTKASTSNPNCFVAYIENPPTFSFSGRVWLPEVNTQLTNYPGCWVYQDFVDAITIHEYWHVSIHKAYAYGAWAAFESWMTTYQSTECATADKALSNGNADLTSAIAKIEATRQAYIDHKDDGHPDRHNVTYQPPDNIHNTKYVKSNSYDWGQSAYNAVAAITVTFDPPKAGNCSCPAPQK